MFRKTAWRNTVSDTVSFHQDQALNTTIFLLKSFGPTGFLLREEGEARNFKVCLGDPHTCTCSVFIKEQEPCKHICWVLLRKFRLPREHEYSFQRGLVERQILEVLHGLQQTKAHRTENDSSAAPRTQSQPVTGREAGSVCRKVIQAQDVCPICQEELLEKKLPVSYCRFGCGNNVHISCMKVWADHQRLSDREETVRCPLCREEFSSVTLLQEQVRNAAKLFTVAEREKPDRHLGVVCQGCRVCPVTGRCFRCTVCSHFYLCEDCSKRGCHPQHPLASRTKRREKWHLVDRSDEASGVTDEPERDGCSLSPISTISVAADLLPEHELRCLPVVRVRPGSRLLDEGQQCRICLQDFSLGQHVRTLPCHHKFHTDCVDRILRKSSSCPLDGYVIYNLLTRRTSERRSSHKSASCLFSDFTKPGSDLKDLFVPGVALRDRKVTPSHGSLNLEVLTGASATHNPQQLILDRIQDLCIDATNTAKREGIRESQRRSSSGHTSKKTATNLSQTQTRERQQLNLFVGLQRPDSEHSAAVASSARRARLKPKRTSVVTVKDANKTVVSELRMTGVLINTQNRTETET